MLGRDMLVSFDTYESARERLEKIERKLAVQLSLGGRCTVRRQLIALARSGKLREDELVADWHDAYAAFCDWYRLSLSSRVIASRSSISNSRSGQEE